MDWEAATAAYLVLHGHPLSYFYSLKNSEKAFIHAAMENSDEIKGKIINGVTGLLAGRRL